MVICLAESSGTGTTQGWLQEVAFSNLHSGQPQVANAIFRCPLYRAWCAGSQTSIPSEEKPGWKLWGASLMWQKGVDGGLPVAETELPKSRREWAMTTACRQNSPTSGRGMFGSGPHPKSYFGCLHGETSFVHGYLNTWNVHDIQTPISWAFSYCRALGWDSRANIILVPRIAAIIVMNLPFDLLLHNRSSISRGQVVVWIFFCASPCPAFILSFILRGINISRICCQLSGSHIPLPLSLAQFFCRHKKTNTFAIIILFNMRDICGIWSPLHGLERSI